MPAERSALFRAIGVQSACATVNAVALTPLRCRPSEPTPFRSLPYFPPAGLNAI